MTGTGELRAQIRDLEDQADAIDIIAELRTHAGNAEAALRDAEAAAAAAAESARAAQSACLPVRARARMAAQRVAQLANIITDKSLDVDVLAEARTQRRSYQDEGAEIIAQLDQLEAASEAAGAASEKADQAVTHRRAVLAVALGAIDAPLLHPVAKATDAFARRVNRGAWTGILAQNLRTEPERMLACRQLDRVLTLTQRGRWVVEQERKEAGAAARRAQEYGDLVAEANDLTRIGQALAAQAGHGTEHPADPAPNPVYRQPLPTFTGGRLGT
jgi:hypothetical protein